MGCAPRSCGRVPGHGRPGVRGAATPVLAGPPTAVATCANVTWLTVVRSREEAPVSLPATARPDDRDALRAAVREVHARSGMSVVFAAGPVQGPSARIDELVGVRTRYLRGLEIRTGAGLGGRVLSEGRPAGVEDYERALDITHEYDGPVLAEGLRT